MVAPVVTHSHRTHPEILAPAGDLESLRAALWAGADAVYFGLDEGFNARARAQNFSRDNLAEVVAEVHRANARAYLTTNTLVFESELPLVVEMISVAARAGIDALIVQDPAIALLAKQICPELELHASTQMTVSSAEGASIAKRLGFTRVVVPRELSTEEIRRFAAATDVELEVFIHGALCMSWSGQCLTSEAWGGRSANRGQCAQSCRLPYELVVDGKVRDLGEVAYLLSPRDLAGVEAARDLVDIGVHSLKIEGRLKGPTYVATAALMYKEWTQALARGVTPEDEARLKAQLTESTVTYSRGMSEGFFAGSDHQTLVDGRYPKHRGAFAGVVSRVDVPRRAVHVDVSNTHEGLVVRAGMGLVFDAGNPEDKNEPGGPVYEVGQQGAELVVRFGASGPNLSQVRFGDRVWVTSDQSLVSRLDRAITSQAPTGRIKLDLEVRAVCGEPLSIRGSAKHASASVQSTSPLARAERAGLTHALLSEKLGALGGTPFHLGAVTGTEFEDGLFVPVAELKELRRALVAALLPQIEAGPVRTIKAVEPMAGREATRVVSTESVSTLVPLVRTDEQLDAVLSLGFAEVELDWMEMVGLGKAVERARAAGLRTVVATTRVQKPGEEGFDARIARLAPDGVLVRHWGAVHAFLNAQTRPVLHGDFSLNVTNSVTFGFLRDLGLDSITASHDLDETQLMAMLGNIDASRLAVTVHHHIPTFHTEHCVYAHLLSEGRDYKTCGRPCEEHQVSLRDRTGREHPVVVDVGCRNTVFNAEAQCAASLVDKLRAQNVGRFRVELVRESRAEAEIVLSSWKRFFASELNARQLVLELKTNEQFGVTKGTMRTLPVLRA